MFVAIPTAIPDDPFANKLGNAAGKTVGSLNSPSYVFLKLTVSDPISFNKNSDTSVNLVSVYLIAAALSPSILPKLPCPFIRGYLVEKS